MSECRDSATALAAASKRFLAAQPPVDPEALAEFEAFVQRDIADFPVFSKLDLDIDLWLAKTRLPESTKTRIREADLYYVANKVDLDYACEQFLDCRSFESLRRRVSPIVYNKFSHFNWLNGFTKAEFMLVLKAARGINARTNGMKARLGPALHFVEDYLYSLVEFIKHVPIVDRPANIMALSRPGCRAGAGDFTTYESSIQREFARVCELALYKHMCPEEHNFLNWIQCLYCEQHVVGRGWEIYMDSSRMSGDMNTSGGNGFSTRELLRYGFWKNGNTDVMMRIEGDDSIFTYYGPPLRAEIFTPLGFRMTLNEGELNKLSFCGMVFDTMTNIVVTNPFYVMATCGFSNTAVGASIRTLITLTASKGLNMMFQYAGCPILAALGARFFRTACREAGMSETEMRQSVLKYLEKSDRINWWEKEYLTAAAQGERKITTPTSTRQTFAELYQITVETQIAIEQKLNSGEGWWSDPIMQTLYSSVEIDGISMVPWIQNWCGAVAGTSTPVRIVNRPITSGPCLNTRRDDLGSGELLSIFTKEPTNVSRTDATPEWWPTG